MKKPEDPTRTPPSEWGPARYIQIQRPTAREKMNADVWFPEEKPPEAQIARATAYGARVGTCGEPSDVIAVGISRCMVIFDLMVRFDGQRDGWSIGRQKWTNIEAGEWEFLELAFVSNDALEWPEQEINPEPSLRS